MRRSFQLAICAVLVSGTTVLAQNTVDLRQAARIASDAVAAVGVTKDDAVRVYEWVEIATAAKDEQTISPKWVQAEGFDEPQEYRPAFAVAPNLLVGWKVSGVNPTVKVGDEVITGKVVVRDHVTDLVAIQVETESLKPLSISPQKTQAGLPIMLSWWDGDVVMHKAAIIASSGAKHPKFGYIYRLDSDLPVEVSGALVVDATGDLLGIVVRENRSMMMLPAGSIERLIVAAAADEPTDLYRGVLGIQLSPDNGSIIANVVPDSPAANAGIAVNDKVVRLNGQDTESANEILAAVALSRGGEEVEIVLLRDEENITKTIALKNVDLPPSDKPMPYGIDASALGDQRLFRFEDGKLVPLAGDDDTLIELPELEISGLKPYMLGELKVERSELEESLRVLEEERARQESMIKKLRDRIGELEAASKAAAKRDRASDIQRLEGLLNELRKRAEDK